MPDISKMRKLGKRTIEVLEYGGQRTKKIKRIVYSKATLTKGHPTYWFELVNGIWKNTTKKGIKTGIVVTKNEFAKLQSNNSKHGKEKVNVNGYIKHKWRCPKCGRAAPEDFCIVHGDVTAVDITKNVKIRKMALEYSTKTKKLEKTKPKPTSLKKETLAYLKKHGYTGLISGEFLAKKEKLGVTLSELKISHLDLMIQADKETKEKEKKQKQKDIIGKQDRAIAKKEEKN